MARSATTTDAFSAIAEPQRRRMLLLLARGEKSVNQLAKTLRVKQPQASKHLRVLKAVGLVVVRVQGQQRFYKLNGAALKPVHDWVKSFEQFWTERFDRLDEHLQNLQAKGKQHDDKT
jgi:DNA-binding transcriptional ArsR family regulator